MIIDVVDTGAPERSGEVISTEGVNIVLLRSFDELCLGIRASAGKEDI